MEVEAKAELDTEDASQRFIEGVSNEVTVAVATAIVLIATVIVYYRKFKSRRSVAPLHPEMAAAVEEYREVLSRVNAPLPDDEGVRLLMAGRDRNDGLCPICFGEASFAVLTNCGHAFCCSCIIGYWRHSSSPLSPVTCAVCRTPVTMLLPVRWEGSAEEELQEANLRIDDYNRRFSGERPWLDVLWDMPVLVPYMLQNLNAYTAMVAVFRLRAYLTLILIGLYILLPLDIFPESIYGLLGLVDDLFIVCLALFYLCITLREYMAHRGEAPLVD